MPATWSPMAMVAKATHAMRARRSQRPRKVVGDEARSLIPGALVLDPVPLSLPSQHHSSGRSSPKRYDACYEKELSAILSAAGIPGSCVSNLFPAASGSCARTGPRSRVHYRAFGAETRGLPLLVVGCASRSRHASWRTLPCCKPSRWPPIDVCHAAKPASGLCRVRRLRLRTA